MHVAGGVYMVVSGPIGGVPPWSSVVLGFEIVGVATVLIALDMTAFLQTVDEASGGRN
jgi:hypothetical protein